MRGNVRALSQPRDFREDFSGEGRRCESGGTRWQRRESPEPSENVVRGEQRKGSHMQPPAVPWGVRLTLGTLRAVRKCRAEAQESQSDGG